jgi:pentachlorophenol monooxygenase
MNTGLQDALNLGWKLAFVLLGRSPAALLETYQDERRPIAQEVLTNTDHMVRLATTTNPVVQNLRDRFLPELKHLPGLEHRILGELSQISVNYRQSPITLDTRHFWPGRSGLHAGDRLPEAELIAPGGERSTIFRQVQPPGFHLFLLPASGKTHGPRSLAAARHLARDLASDFGPWLKTHWIIAPQESLHHRADLPPHWLDVGGSLAQLFGLQSGGLLLVRPDYYVGYAAGDFNSGQVRLSTLQYWT